MRFATKLLTAGIVASFVLSAAPALATSGDTLSTKRQEQIDRVRKKLTDPVRPPIRVVRKRATGERDDRADLRKKKQLYTGGIKERVNELKFHRQERRKSRKTAE